MSEKVLLIVDNGERITDYLMDSDEANKAFNILGDFEAGLQVDVIALSATPHRTAEEVITEWKAIENIA